MTTAAMGQQEVIGLTFSRPAGGTIAKGKLVKSGTDNTVVVTTAIADTAIGVALATVSSGQSCPIQATGIAGCISGATITDGQEVMCKASSTGEIDVAAGATARSVGIAIGGSASGETQMVLLGLPALKGPANT